MCTAWGPTITNAATRRCLSATRRHRAAPPSASSIHILRERKRALGGIAASAGPISTRATSAKCWRTSTTLRLRSAKARSRPPGTVRFYDKGALAGPTLVGLWRFRRCAQVSSGPQPLLLIGLPILRKQFHLSREQVLIFPEDIGGRLGIADMLG